MVTCYLATTWTLNNNLLCGVLTAVRVDLLLNAIEGNFKSGVKTIYSLSKTKAKFKPKNSCERWPWFIRFLSEKIRWYVEGREQVWSSGNAWHISSINWYGRFWCLITSLLTVITGRPWLASELRHKSFKDLHTLWYVCLREKNLLATQKEEVRRMGVTNSELQVSGEKVRNVRAPSISSIGSWSNFLSFSVGKPWLGLKLSWMNDA